MKKKAKPNWGLDGEWIVLEEQGIKWGFAFFFVFADAFVWMQFIKILAIKKNEQTMWDLRKIMVTHL